MKTKYFQSVFVVVLGFAFLPSCFHVGSTAAYSQEFSVKLEPEKPSFLLGEPVALSVAITHTGRSELWLSHPLDKHPYSKSLEMKFGESDAFVRIKTRAEAHDELVDRTKLPDFKVQPGSVIERRFILLGTADHGRSETEGQLIFERPGSYAIQFVVGFEDNRYSANCDIAVVAPTRTTDKQAWDRLIRDQLIGVYSRLDSALTSGTARTDAINKLKEFVKRHPTSQYSDFVKMMTRPPVKARHLERTTVEENAMVKLTKELEGKWYDMRSVSRSRAPWARELARKTIQFHEQWAQGKMSQKEAWRREAELTKEYVLKNDKPLSKSEWHRRHKFYAERDAAQKARQRAVQMRNAPERARILREAIEKRRREQAKPK
jgi:hypothetical protein